MRGDDSFLYATTRLFTIDINLSLIMCRIVSLTPDLYPVYLLHPAHVPKSTAKIVKIQISTNITVFLFIRFDFISKGVDMIISIF